MSVKDDVITEIIKIEGGYVNDPYDSGGETKYGITESVARTAGYAGPMIDLPYDLAFQIYAARYWAPIRGDSIEMVDEYIAREVADTAVNMGVHRAATFLQRSLNVLNNRATLWADLTVDGQIGGKTIASLQLCHDKRADGMSVLLTMLNCLQGAKYVELAEAREKDEKFIYGWFRNRVYLTGH